MPKVVKRARNLKAGSWAVKDNPVVKRFVKGAVAFVALFGLNVGGSGAENAIDVLSLAVAAYQMFAARSEVTPV